MVVRALLVLAAMQEELVYHVFEAGGKKASIGKIQRLCRNISSAAARVRLVILRPPSIRATSSRRSGAANRVTAVSVRLLLGII
jgi:hypothetical protein